MQGASDPVPPCPRCHATPVVRNGRTQAGSPNFLCRGCGRRFAPPPEKGPVPDDRGELVRRLLRERLRRRAIARAAGVSRSWPRRPVNGLYRGETPWEPGPLKRSRARS